MLNFPGLRGPADVRGGGPHAGAPGPAKRKSKRGGTERPRNRRRLAQIHASPTSAASVSPVQVTKAEPRVEG